MIPSQRALEAALSDQRYCFTNRPINGHEVDYGHMPILMADLFWLLVADDPNHLPPTQDEFAEWFVQRSKDAGSKASEEALRSRAMGAWPSYIRELHMAACLQEHFPIVIRSSQLDRKNVADLLVSDGHYIAGVALSIQTFKGLQWEAIKQSRHVANPAPKLRVLRLRLDREFAYHINPTLELFHPSNADYVVRWFAREMEFEVSEADMVQTRGEKT